MGYYSTPVVYQKRYANPFRSNSTSSSFSVQSPFYRSVQRNSSNILGKRKSSPKRSGWTVTPQKKRKQRQYRLRAVLLKKGTHKGASTSKSSGFFKTSKRSLKKYRTASLISKKGVLLRIEAGNVITPKRCGYVGHATMPHNSVNLHLWRAIIKALAIKSNIQIDDFDADVPGTLVGIDITLVVRFNYDVNNTTDVTYTIPGGGTWEGIANYFASQTYTQNEEFQFIKIGWTLGVIPSELHLVEAKIMVDVKSSLKIQNRSKNSEGAIEADDVDNVPLYGKTYEAWSAGLRYDIEVTGLGKRFVANATNGLLDITVDTNDTTIDPNGLLAEPPIPSYFVGIKKCGKVHLDPGYIKTSVLSERFTMSLDQFLIKLYGATGGSVKVRGELGKVRVFALEKMLEVNTGPLQTITAMNIAYEHDLKIGMCLIGSTPSKTTQVINDINGNNA